MTHMNYPNTSEFKDSEHLDPAPAEIGEQTAFEGFEEAIHHKYRDEQGRLRMMVLRKNDTKATGGRDKSFRPVTAWRSVSGKVEWRMKGFPPGKATPLYGRDLLASFPDRPVFVVEGEKCADAVANRFPKYVAVTAPGGSNGVKTVDLSGLFGRDVILAGDDDDPGRKAVNVLGQRLHEIGAKRVRVLDIAELGHRVSGKSGDGYDIADAIENGLSGEMFDKLIIDHPTLLSDFDTPTPPEPEGEAPGDEITENAVLADLSGGTEWWQPCRWGSKYPKRASSRTMWTHEETIKS